MVRKPWYVPFGSPQIIEARCVSIMSAEKFLVIFASLVSPPLDIFTVRLTFDSLVENNRKKKRGSIELDYATCPWVNDYSLIFVKLEDLFMGFSVFRIS